MQWRAYLQQRMVLLIIFCGLLVVAGIKLMPGFIPDGPVVRIGVAHKGASLPDGFFLYQNLTARGIAIKSIIPGQDGLVIRLETEEQRLATQKILKELLSDDYTTA